MFKGRALVLVLVGLALSGCTRLAVMTDGPLAAFEQARSEQAYERALDIAQHLDKDHPDHGAMQERVSELRDEIETFENNAIERAETLAEKRQWEKVWQVLAEAMDQWRPSPALREARQRLREREQRQRRQTLGQLLLAEARWRLTHAALAERLTRFTDGVSQNRYQSWQARNRDLARKLVDHARWFAERGDWQQVHDYLQSARALDADRVPDQLLARAQEKHSARSRRSRAQRARRQRQQTRQQVEKARTLLERYLDTGKLEDLLTLRRIIRKHANEAFPEKLTARVEILSRERYRAAVDKGDAHYARGDYRAARSIWRRVKPLAPPGSELPEKLERVERVLSKLKNLEKQ